MLPEVSLMSQLHNYNQRKMIFFIQHNCYNLGGRLLEIESKGEELWIDLQNRLLGKSVPFLNTIQTDDVYYNKFC